MGTKRTAILVASLVLAACGGDDGGVTAERAEPHPTTTTVVPAEERPTTTVEATTTTAPAANPRPEWLGTRVLPLRPDGLGEIQPTPPELDPRHLETVDVLPPPTTEAWTFDAASVPDDVLSRSTWEQACPVAREDLRYVTLPFWGFDQELHTGELLVHVDAVEAIAAGFQVIFERRFPIEEMRITRADELDAPPTGDGNNTGAFVCRPSVGSTSWSEHAYGRAVDINPFHNPYVKGDIVIPELASTYADRDDLRLGMLTVEEVAGFTGAGWGWGGQWRSSADHMHLSASGR